MIAHLIYTAIVLAVGFGLGRTKHIDNLIAGAKNLVAKVKGVKL